LPKIPVLNRQYDQTSGGISPDVAALPGRAIQGFGQAVSGVSDIYQMRKVAERNTKLLKIENMMNEDKRAFADMLRMDTNYDGLEERADKVLTGFQDRYSKEIQNDPKGMEALNRAYGQFSNELRNMAWERRNSLHITERNVELDKAIKNKLNDYALETDSTNRKAITDTTFALIDAGVADGTLDLSNAQKIKDSFKLESEVERAKYLIEVAPDLAVKQLEKGSSDFDIDEDKKGELRRAAETASEQLNTQKRIAKNQAEADAKEALSLAHKEEERQIGDLFINGDFVAASESIRKSNLLTGDEKKNWMKAIEDKQKEPEGTPVEQAKEIIKINDMISKGEDIDKIRNTIITSKLKKEDREQYINKLESSVDKEIKEGTAIGYSDIKSFIDPSYDNRIIPKTSIIPDRIRDAQLALDQWIENEKSNNRFLSRLEIRNKAREIGKSYQLSLSERYSEVSKDREETLKAMELSEMNISEISDVDKTRIKDALTKAGIEPTDEAILETYIANQE
jgi:hypothetical protein